MKPKVIGLVGRKQCGKDTVYELMREMTPCKRIAFADPLREEVGAVLGGEKPIPYDVPVVLRDFLETEIEQNGLRPASDAFRRPYQPRIRKILQWWGTEYRRILYGMDYWLDRFRAAVRAEPDTLWVVTDVRFINEAECIKGEGGILWRITRPEADMALDSHVSEGQIPKIQPCIVLENRWGIEELKINVRVGLRLSGVLP